MNAYGDTGTGERNGGLSALLRECRSALVATRSDDAAKLRAVPGFRVAAPCIHDGDGCENQSIGRFKASIENSETSTGSFEAPIENSETSTGSFEAPIENSETSTGSFETSIGNSNASTGSFEASIENSGASTGSFKASVGNSGASTGSFKAPIGNFEASTGSLKAPIGNFEASTGSFNQSIESSNSGYMISMKARSHAPGSGSHAGSPPPGVRSTVFR